MSVLRKKARSPPSLGPLHIDVEKIPHLRPQYCQAQRSLPSATLPVLRSAVSYSRPYRFPSKSRLKSWRLQEQIAGGSMLILTRRIGESLKIGEEVTITVLGVKG